MIYKTIQNMVTEMDTQSVIYKNSDYIYIYIYIYILYIYIYIYIYIIMRHVPIQERTLQRSTIIFFFFTVSLQNKKVQVVY